jgi:TRAP-type C4-dicarboxylate transport system permease small subunit
MQRFYERLERLLKAIVVILIVLMLAVLALQVFMRYFFNKPLSWSEELALLGFAWVVVLSSSIAVRRVSHARLDVIFDALSNSARQVLEKFISFSILALGIFLAYAGWSYLAETSGTRSPAVGYPIALLYSTAPVFGMLIAVFSFEKLVNGTESDHD